MGTDPIEYYFRCMQRVSKSGKRHRDQQEAGLAGSDGKPTRIKCSRCTFAHIEHRPASLPCRAARNIHLMLPGSPGRFPGLPGLEVSFMENNAVSPALSSTVLLPPYFIRIFPCAASRAGNNSVPLVNPDCKWFRWPRR